MAHKYTWDKLVKNAYRLNPKSRGHRYPYTPKFEISAYTSGPNRGQKVIVPFVGTKSVLISLRAWGVTQASLHNVTMLFSEVDIQKQDPHSTNYFQIQYEGEMYWIRKLDKFKNPLTARCTCFTGDTKVLLADGTSKTFKELEGQTDFEIISYNEKSDKFEIVKAYNCEKKKDNTEIVRVTLDNGKYIDCTPDHRFLTRQGQWIQAQDLEIGQSLRALYMDKYNLQRLLPDGSKQKIKKHQPKADFYVYVYLDPRYPGKYEYSFATFDYKPIYVGKGRQNRCYHHLNCNINDPFHNTLNKLKELQLQPIILKQAIKLEEHSAFELEKRMTQEIGLQCLNEGPLLNLKHGGEGGSSLIGSIKTKIANILNGSFEKHRQRMLENNPMCNSDIAKRMADTWMFNHDEQQRKDIAYKACHTLSYEQRQQLGKAVGEHTKQAVLDGTHHTLTEEWKQICKNSMEKRLQDPVKCEEFKSLVSKTSKKNWEDPQIRKQMQDKMRAKKQQKTAYLFNNTIEELTKIVKQYGTMDLDKYNYVKGYNYSVNMIKSNGQFEKIKSIVNQNALLNHTVVSVEKIENADVYCLTAEYLGNFVVDTSDTDSNIFSGVVEANCADFFFTFAWYNYHNAHCLYGPAPRPYQKKTNRPPRNPQGIPGVCKHIYNAWEILRNSGLTIN